MSVNLSVSKAFYKTIVKPVLFTQSAETAHNQATKLGSFLAASPIGRKITSAAFSYDNENFLRQDILKIKLPNPIGLAAGFDYDGHMSRIMKHTGFGFNTVGTVTARPYEGNKGIRLDRLPASKSLLVNKGFKSEGVDKVIKRLDSKGLDNTTLGVSVGSSNLPQVDTIPKAINDYVYTFNKFKTRRYIKYFELNISCPNTSMTESFTKKHHFAELLKAVESLKIKQPIFVKMANEMELNEADRLIHEGLKHGVSGFIFSNLLKNRNSKYLNSTEVKKFSDLKGNFSGKPTFENSNKLIKHAYREYGKYMLIVGCGGVFSAKDAYKKIRLGASLVQMITGMIYEGPQVAGEINEGLVKLLKRDGMTHISEAIGLDA